MTRLDDSRAGRLGTIALVVAALPAFLLLATSLRDGIPPSGWGSVLYYLGIPAAICGLCLAALRLPPAPRSNVGLLLLSSMASCFFAEAVLQRRIRMDAAGRVRHDGRLTKLDVLADLRLRGVRAVPAVYPSFFVLGRKLDVDGAPTVPLGGVSNASTVFCNEGNQIVAYESDEHGFNNPKGLWTSGVQILVVGDSFVQGDCVPTKQTIGGRLRAEVGSTLALGMGGDGPLMELAALREYVPPLRPRAVLWLYYEGNDLSDLKRDREDPVLRRYLEEGAFSQHLVSRQDRVDRALTAYAERGGVIRDAMRRANPWDGMLRLRALRARLAELFAPSIRRRERLGPQGGAGDADPDESYARDYTEGEVELLAKVLTVAQKVARSAGTELIFVYLPEWRRYSAPEGADRSREAVLEVASLCGLPVVDMHAVFSRQRDPEALFQFIGEKGGHYNEAGYRLVARTLSAELRSLRLVSSR